MRSSSSNPHEMSSRDHVPVTETELDAIDDAVSSAPIESVHPEVVAMESCVRGRFVIIGRIATHHYGRARLEDELSVGTQDS